MGLFLNGALHWESRNEKDGFGKIIAFDLAKERFYDVPLPPSRHLQLPPLKFCYQDCSMGVVGEYLYYCVNFFQYSANVVWVMKEYCNEASWVHFVSYRGPYGDREVTYVPNSIPISAKNGGYVMLQYSTGCIDVLRWISNNNPDEAEGQYSKKIKFFERHLRIWSSVQYTEALTSPYASTAIH
ncbi:hypothetical protein Tsubulata_046351 [Turnera subulata]|uniref:F-box associated beta-propeller type 1 domain-containing protein n=1 Tax=Turnera subulata TaxID=218843 RepID=A0A9Q0JQD6_9ROSI|nr:hypothetical protein Tsubulata_046351 [Turnera subulata]